MISWTGMLGGPGTVSGKLLHEHIRYSPGRVPVVVWNLTKRCNLQCTHCYQDASLEAAEGAVSEEDAPRVLEELKEAGVRIVLFSGGEPLMRPDIFSLIEKAVALDMRPTISTNGTLIDADTAAHLKEVGCAYVGVSIDGMRKTHDKFRGARGSFKKALEGLRHAREAGINTGVRFTLSGENVKDLPSLLDLVEEERIPRFCMYHLVYAGRGKQAAMSDVDNETRRQVAGTLFERAEAWVAGEKGIEMLSVDNHVDGIYVVKRLKRTDPSRADHAREILTRQMGCPAGCKISCIDPDGMVHACQFWGHVTLGSVVETRFMEIWSDAKSCEPESREESLKGRCGRCVHKAYCGGCRIRAEHVYGDHWQEDPSCYLTDEEILQPLLPVPV